MSILKISLAPVGYTDWLRVAVSKVSDLLDTPIWETWVDVPGVDAVYTPDLAPENYKVRFFNAANNTDPGLLLSPWLILNGLNPAVQYERRWYEIGNMPTSALGTATINAAGTVINDPYLIGKVIETNEKESFRQLKEGDEIAYDLTTGDVSSLNGIALLSSNEKFLIIIANRVGSVSPITSQFAGSVDVLPSTYTILAADKNKRFKGLGTASTQAITAPPLVVLNDGDFIFIDNTVGGTALQMKILTDGADRIRYNGFNLTINLLSEFWIGKGESVKLMKSGSYWEVVSYYTGYQVGERMVFGSVIPHYAIPETGLLYVSDNYPRKKWWLQNVLDSSAKIVDNTITSGGWTRPSGKEAYYFVTSTYSHFRTPDTDTIVQIFLRRI